MDESFHRSVLDWLTRWESLVRERDVDGAREMFRDDVVAFGTYRNRVQGLEELVEEQWRPIWSDTEGFAFAVDEAVFLFSTDGLLVCVALPWTSYGIRSGGERFSRPGRCTLVLQRSTLDEEWLAVHSHFSLNVVHS